jgi:glycosyltransferase involved in cell wall biosynthesis
MSTSMRIGANPAKSGVLSYIPKKLGIALILYIPHVEGYFEHSLEIFKYQLSSLQASTTQPFDLLVFDNGSCPQVVAELQSLYSEEYFREKKQLGSTLPTGSLPRIDWLVLSQHNLGKAGAWNWIFAAMPNELICYADSDVLFRPGWLEASLEILQTFPQAGMISAQPNFFDVMQGEGKAHLDPKIGERYTLGEYWPASEVIDEYCFGIGASAEVVERFHQKPLPALTNQEKTLQAVLGASHMQFVIPKHVARQAVPLPAEHALLRRETMALDYKIDELGYLHLSTLKPFVFHMGNTINQRLLEEVQLVSRAPSVSAEYISDEYIRARTGQSSTLPQNRAKLWMAKLARRPRFNRLFRRAYNLLFQVLNTED